MSRRLTEEAFRFDFFQAVRLLERLAQLAPGPKRAVGYDFHPSEETVRFRSVISLAFPAADIQRVQPGGNGQVSPYEMAVTIMGLAADGVLPQHYTILLLNRLRQRDFAMRDFLDLFNHRMVSFFYRAWEKYRYPVQYERVRPPAAQAQARVLQLGAARKLTREMGELNRTILHQRRLNRTRPDPDEGLATLLARQEQGTARLEVMGLNGNDEDGLAREIRRLRERLASPYDLSTHFAHSIYSLTGLGQSGLRGRMEFEDEAILYYSGNLARRPRNVTCLQRMLCETFGINAVILQFTGRWLLLGPRDQSRLSSSREPSGSNCGLGSTLVLGERVWDVEGKFTVQLGPLDREHFRRYLPSGDAMQPLQQMVRFYVGPQFDFDVQLILRAQDVPQCQLGGAASPASRLGWDTWLHGGQFPHDARDSVFSCEG